MLKVRERTLLRQASHAIISYHFSNGSDTMISTFIIYLFSCAMANNRKSELEMVKMDVSYTRSIALWLFTQ